MRKVRNISVVLEPDLIDNLTKQAKKNGFKNRSTFIRLLIKLGLTEFKKYYKKELAD